MMSQSESRVALANVGYCWFIFLSMISTRALLSHTISNWDITGIDDENALERNNSIDPIPKASALKEVIGNPKTRPRPVISLLELESLTIHPYEPDPCLTDPSLAAEKDVLVVVHWLRIRIKEYGYKNSACDKRRSSMGLSSGKPDGEIGMLLDGDMMSVL